MRYSNAPGQTRLSHCLLSLLLLLAVSLAGCARQQPKDTDETTATDTTTQAPTTTAAEPGTGKAATAGKPVKVDPAVKQPFSQAVTALRNNNPQTTIDLLTPLSQSHQGYAGIWVNLGIAYYQLKQQDSARSAFEKAISQDPGQAAAHNYIAHMERQAGQFQQAKAAYERALQANPDYALVHLNIGILYDLYLHQPERALAHYREYQILSGTADKTVSKWVIDLERRTKAGKKGR